MNIYESNVVLESQYDQVWTTASVVLNLASTRAESGNFSLKEQGDRAVDSFSIVIFSSQNGVPDHIKSNHFFYCTVVE